MYINLFFRSKTSSSEVSQPLSYSPDSDMRYKASQASVTFPIAGKVDDDMEYDDDDEEYDDDDYYTMEKTGSPLETKSNGDLESSNKRLNTISSDDEIEQQTKKSIPLETDVKYSIVQSQNGKSNYIEAKTTTPEPIPEGFKGRIHSGNLEKKVSDVTYETKKYNTRFLPSKHADDNKIKEDGKKEINGKNPDSYVTVTKSVTGQLDDSNPSNEGKNFSSTYYTKSSTCGYFTFSCNIVYGANGRSKICRPKPPSSNGKC